jgi:hypothetical protein
MEDGVDRKEAAPASTLNNNRTAMPIINIALPVSRCRKTDAKPQDSRTPAPSFPVSVSFLD